MYRLSLHVETLKEDGILKTYGKLKTQAKGPSNVNFK
jgi:hypothetical protein